MAAPLTLIAAAALFAAATPAIVAQAGPHHMLAGPVQVKSFAYGSDPREVVTLYTRADMRHAPVILYIHGGGWSLGTPDAGKGAQPEHFTRAGYAWATVGYRFVPAVTVEQQLAEVAQAIAAIRKRAGKAVDPDRIVLLGHSSGGQFAALLGTDPHWLTDAGVPFEAVKAVVLLDAAALDIPPIMRFSGGTIDAFYKPAFGSDPARQAALSPVNHVAMPNAPAWLMLHDVNNGLAGLQSRQFADGLVLNQAREATVVPVSDTSHLKLNDDLGKPGDGATEVVDGFLGRVFP